MGDKEETVYSYEILYDILRQEKNKDDLQQLDPDFYLKVKEFLDIKNEEIKNASHISSDEVEIIRKRLFNIKKMVTEIYERRERKILMLAINKSKDESNIIETSSLLSSEEVFFNKLVDLFIDAKKDSLNLIVPEKKPSTNLQKRVGEVKSPFVPNKPVEENTLAAKRTNFPSQTSDDDSEIGEDENGDEKEDLVEVFTKSSIPRLASRKMVNGVFKTYGPFDEGETVTVPRDIANLLVKKEKAEYVE